jgi:hypothetical protein
LPQAIIQAGQPASELPEDLPYPIGQPLQVIAKLDRTDRLLRIGRAGYFEMDCPATLNRN